MRDSYVPNFKVPGPKKPSAKMWVTILLCVVLPPVGMVLLWGKTRSPLRGKVLMTFVSVAVMVLVIVLALRLGEKEGRQSIYSPIEATPAVSVPAPEAQNQPVAPAETIVPAPGRANDVVPANPAG